MTVSIYFGSDSGKKKTITVKKYFLGEFHAVVLCFSVDRFRFRYRDLEFHSFGSETDSETPFSLKSVPSPIPRRDLDRESRCFGSETREPGISAMFHFLNRVTATAFAANVAALMTGQERTALAPS